MQNSLVKYRIGLGVLGVFSLVIVGLVLVQASASKADKDTDKAATKIADKLDAYVSSSYEIPSSLSAAGVKDVPDTVRYEKVSNTSYKFCVTYKSDSSGFDATEAVDDVTAGDVSSSADSSSDDGPRSSSYLYLPSTHHKGENCQTVTPYSAYSNYYDDYSDYDSNPSLLEN